MVSQGYVLGLREGEHLVLRGGDILIKVIELAVSMVSQWERNRSRSASGIPIHRHLQMDEAF